VQATPYIGSKTLRYPINYYLSKKGSAYSFHSFSIPKQGETVCTVRTSKLLREAFDFPPGKTITIKWSDKGKQKSDKWEVFTNAYNYSYFYCYTTGAAAYFVNDGTLFYFTDFYGSKQSALHHFYLATQRVLLGYYPDVSIEDKVMIQDVFPAGIKVAHDLTAPFFHYCKAGFSLKFISADNDHEPSEIVFSSNCNAKVFGRRNRQIQYIVSLSNNSIDSFSFNNGKHSILFKCIS